MPKSFGRLGTMALAAYLTLSGLIQLVNLHFAGLGLFMGLLAIVAGVLIFVGR